MSGVTEPLLGKAVLGDRDALALLLERHGSAVRRALAGRISRRWQALLTIDDVLQQTYAEAFESIRSFDPAGSASFCTWLKTLARRNLLDVLRGLQAAKRGGNHQPAAPRGREESLVLLSGHLGVTTETPSHLCRRREAHGALTRAIARLPAVQRKVVNLYDLEGQSADAVAATLGRRVGAIYMLRARAHRRLQELLGTGSQYLSH